MTHDRSSGPVKFLRSCLGPLLGVEGIDRHAPLRVSLSMTVTMAKTMINIHMTQRHETLSSLPSPLLLFPNDPHDCIGTEND